MPSNLNSEFRLLGPGEVEERLGKKNRFLEHLKAETVGCGNDKSSSEGSDYLRPHVTVASFIHASLQQQLDESNSESDSVSTMESSSVVSMSALKRNRPSDPTDPVEGLESTENSDPALRPTAASPASCDGSQSGSIEDRRCKRARTTRSFPTVFYNIGGKRIPVGGDKLEIVKMVNLMSDLFQEKLDWHLDSLTSEHQEEHEPWKFQVSMRRAEEELLREEVTKANKRLARMDAQLREISSRRNEVTVTLKNKDQEVKDIDRDGRNQIDRLIAEKDAIQAKLNSLQIYAHEQERNDSGSYDRARAA